jgi:hypothetical protein
MKILLKTKAGNINEGVAVEVLHELESFLVRRAICSIEPTGLHAVFKGLCFSLDGRISGTSVVQYLGKIKTVEYPTDKKVRKFRHLSLDGKGIGKYFLWVYDRSLGGICTAKKIVKTGCG